MYKEISMAALAVSLLALGGCDQTYPPSQGRGQAEGLPKNESPPEQMGQSRAREMPSVSEPQPGVSAPSLGSTSPGSETSGAASG